jgi:hypothetical protein
MRNATLVVLGLAVATLGPGCGGPAEGNPSENPASLSVEPERLDLEVGDRASVASSLRDSGGLPAEGIVVTWSSSDAAVARVSPTGDVTAVGGGRALLRAFGGGRSATVEVIVQGGSAPTAIAADAGPGRPPPAGAVSAVEAARLVGEERTVCDRVSEAIAPSAGGDGPTLLLFGDAFPYQAFAIVIDARVRNAFRAAHGEDPDALLRGRSICADGRIEPGAGAVQSPRLVVAAPERITW